MVDQPPKRLSRTLVVDGAKLRKIRESLHWTQSEAGRQAGYTTRLIRKLESSGSVSRDTLYNVVTAYQEAIRAQSLSGLPTVLRAADFILCAPKDDMERVAYEWFDRVFNRRDLSAVADLVHEDVQLIAEGQTLCGREAVRARLQAILDGFNPLRHCVEHLFTDRGTTIIYWQVEATHSGPFFGIPATGREIAIRGSTLAIIRNGKFMEARDHWDAKELIDQIT